MKLPVTPRAPTAPQARPPIVSFAALMKAPTGLWRVRRPITSSAIMIGRPIRAIANR